MTKDSRWIAAGQALAAAAAIVCTATACSFDPPGECVTDTQCTRGLSCKSGVCAGCSSGADCSEWQACTSDHRCLALAGKCDTAGDCQQWEGCSADHQCATLGGRCGGDADCAAWESCNGQHACAPKQGKCNVEADCLLGLSCTDHSCVFAVTGGDVLLLGTLAEGLACHSAIARLDAPDRPVVGFGCHDGLAKISPAGSIIYSHSLDVNTGKWQIRALNPDAFEWDKIEKRWQYPSQPVDNDREVISSPVCPQTNGGPAWVMQQGTGDVVYPCPSGSTTDYYDGAGVKRVAGALALAWNNSGAFLVADSSLGLTIQDPAGVRTPIVGLASASGLDLLIVPPRAHGDGFYVVGYGGSTAELWEVYADATAAKVGNYAPVPDGYLVRGPRALDSAGLLYEAGTDLSNALIQVVARRPLWPGVATIPYSEKNAPTNLDWSVTPPRLYVKMEGSTLITGP